MPKFEYVLSGLSFVRIKSVPQADRLLAATKACLRHLNEFSPTHDVALLYNAMTEVSMIEIMDHFRDDVNSIHSDSGGLQIAQRGLTLTPQIEEKIYAAQLKGSEIAMSFDFIPIKIVGEGDPKVLMHLKKYVHTENEECGIRSGLAARRQLEYFANNPNPYNTKPLIIIQGNSRDDYHTYFNSIMKQIPKELYSSIGGFAIAGSSIGIGALEAFDSIFSFADLDVPDEVGKRLHFLGYGCINRLLPIITTYKSGVISQYEISYDSTTHTKNYVFGRVLDPGLKQMNFGTIPHNPEASKLFGIMYDEFEPMISDNLGVDRDEWIWHTTKNLTAKAMNTMDTIDEQTRVLGGILTAFYSIKNFIKACDSLIGSFDSNQHITRLKNHGVFNHLLDCKTSDQWFDSYRSEVMNYLSSNRIERIGSVDDVVTLENLFG